MPAQAVTLAYNLVVVIVNALVVLGRAALRGIVTVGRMGGGPGYIALAILAIIALSVVGTLSALFA